MAGSGSITADDIRRVIRAELVSYALQTGSSDVDVQSPEPAQAAANLDALTGRLEEW